ncbi:mechanosensitive ion channel family protein [Candidatus Micrarchaeota archaeon]|nr:mechanosensitive ion channel family protein [Candidatus Micrarchaeota archaeon]
MVEAFNIITEEFLASKLLNAVLIIIAAVIVARVVMFIFKSYMEKLTSKTKTTLDDRIVKSVEDPLYFTIIGSGIYIALLGLPEIRGYVLLLDRGFMGLLILIGMVFSWRLVHEILDWYSQEAAPKTKIGVSEILPTLKRLLSLVVVIIGLVMLLDNFGVQVTPLIASLGIAGLAVALAFQDTLANFFAGIYITADRPVKLSDYVKLDSGDEGYVDKIGWRSTHIRTLANNLVIIPNTKLAQSIITNYCSPSKEMGLVIPVSVAYGSDLRKVEEVVVEVSKDVLKNTRGAVIGFEPFVRYGKFADSGIELSAILRVEEYVDKYLVTHEFIKSLHERFEEEGIEIPFPKRSVYIEKMPGGERNE